MELKLLPLLLIMIAIITRIVPHPANVAPITALALFAAVYLPKKYGFVIPLVGLFISDMIIGFYGWTMLFVYGSFILSGIIGFWIKRYIGVARVIGGSLLASVLFFLISNFGVWVEGRMYTQNLAGLIECYIAGLPFFRNTLLGDLFFVGVFFGGYELIKVIVRKLLPVSARKLLI